MPGAQFGELQRAAAAVNRVGHPAKQPRLDGPGHQAAGAGLVDAHPAGDGRHRRGFRAHEGLRRRVSTDRVRLTAGIGAEEYLATIDALTRMSANLTRPGGARETNR
ncbi:hypothetical protein [Streptosporangium sp. NPDC002721]|uniref:hypothetical protein n=1 Tax=Streptosporangium sp. NPDC002721 TaxID=3366188 RepID=UPI00369F9E08